MTLACLKEWSCELGRYTWLHLCWFWSFKESVYFNVKQPQRWLYTVLCEVGNELWLTEVAYFYEANIGDLTFSGFDFLCLWNDNLRRISYFIFFLTDTVGKLDCNKTEWARQDVWQNCHTSVTPPFSPWLGPKAVLEGSSLDCLLGLHLFPWNRKVNIKRTWVTEEPWSSSTYPKAAESQPQGANQKQDDRFHCCTLHTHWSILGLSRLLLLRNAFIHQRR